MPPTILMLEGSDAVRSEPESVGISQLETIAQTAATAATQGTRIGLTITPLTNAVAKQRAGTHSFGDLLGGAPVMRELIADLQEISASDFTVLIEGETGTGKDLVAESLHRASIRGTGPFVVFDCGGAAPALAEIELFGHERGAFTGAMSSRPGVFELANGGTLFLDELGELGKDLQPKLLRILERREVRRVGGIKSVPVDVRVIAATNRNLHAEVLRGAFRQDLFFRIAALRVAVPALRDRKEDLPLLVAHFLAQEIPPRPLEIIPPRVWEMFSAYHWPGNVRELHNQVRRLLVTPERVLTSMVQTGQGEGGLNASGPEAGKPLRVARREASERFERAYLIATLERAQGNVTRAAAIAGVSRQMFTKLIQKHGLRAVRVDGSLP